MSDTCAGVTGQQAAVRDFVGGSALGWGPVPAAWSAKPLLDGTDGPTAWSGPIGMAGWECFSETGLRRCFESLSQKYPPGWAFAAASDVTTTLGADVLACAEVTYDVNRLAVALLDEWICRTAWHTLPEWWSDYGLPDDCGINQLCAKVAAIGGASCTYFTDLALTLGYDICCNELPPETQVGCWNLGCDQMPPRPEYKGGGCDLGVIQMGISGVTEAFLAGRQEGAGLGFNMGRAQLGECGEVAPPPDPDPCGEWVPPEAKVCLLAGNRAPWTLDYTGTAYIMQTGVHGSANEALSPFHAVTGTWSLGIGELCQPAGPEVLCFIAKYRPAHVVPVATRC